MLLIQRNISRWARALDASKPMPIYMSEELPDLPEYSAINRAVPQMPSGMEKEEECEHHLQRAIVTGLIIPTPEVIHMGDTSVYNRLYPPTYKVPRQLIHMQPFAMKQDIPDYDMDSEDEHWVNAQMKVMDITPLKFEEIMDRLEKNSGHSVVTQSEAKLLLKEDDDLIISVYDYWLNKRLKTQTPLIPWVKTEAHRGGKNNNSPYLAFRRRTEKMQTRKNRKNDETSYEKMVKLRRDLSRALTLLELVKRRENTKRELFHLTIEVYEKRYQANDFSGHLLAEVSAIKHSRPAFAPLFINQYDVHGHSANWTKSPKEDSTPRKEKRQYKKRKHKTTSILSGCVLTPGDTIPGLLSSGNDEIILPRQSPNSEEVPFVFHRNKLCKYQAPISNGGLGNWPWCSREEGGMADRKFRYSLTSIATPKTRCIGFTRRRLGRGGRIILDRAGPSMDEYWASMDFTILDSTKEKERLSMELSRDYLHYCPAQETPSVFNSNFLTLQVEDLSDLSTNDHFTNVQLNLNELFPSIADTFPVDGSPGFSMEVDSKEYCVKVDTRKEISAESRIAISEQTDPFVYGNSNFLKQSSSTASLIEKLSPSLTNSNILVKEDKSTPVNLNCAAPRRNFCTVLNNERKENSNGSLLDRWARFKCNPEPRETDSGIKRSKFSVSQFTGNPASSHITPGHLQNVW